MGRKFEIRKNCTGINWKILIGESGFIEEKSN